MKVFIVCSLAVLSVLAFARADNVSNDLQQLDGDSAAPDGLNLEPIDQSIDRIRRSPGNNKGYKFPKPPKGSGYPKPPKGSGYPKPPKGSGYPKPPKDTNGWPILNGPLVFNVPSNSPPSHPSYPYPPHQPSYPYPPQSQPPQHQSNPQPNPWPYNG